MCPLKMMRNSVFAGHSSLTNFFCTESHFALWTYSWKKIGEKRENKKFKKLEKTLFTKPAQWVFEMDVLESTDEEIAFLCDTAMCGDHGIGKMYDSRLELPKCIAKGDDICALRYIKNKKEE